MKRALNPARRSRPTRRPSVSIPRGEEAIRLNPEGFGYYEKKAQLLDALGAEDSVLLGWVRHTAGKFPAQYAAQMMLADMCSLAAGKEEDAVRAYKAAIRLSPDSVEPYLRLGEFLGKAGRHQEAAKVFSDGLKAGPGDIRLQYDYGVACFMTGQREEALKWLGEVIKQDPDFQKVRFLLQKLGE